MLDLVVVGVSVVVFLLFFWILMGGQQSSQKRPATTTTAESGSTNTKKSKRSRTKGKGVVYFDELEGEDGTQEEGSHGIQVDGGKGPKVVGFKSQQIKKTSRNSVAVKTTQDEDERKEQAQADLRKGFVPVQKKPGQTAEDLKLKKEAKEAARKAEEQAKQDAKKSKEREEIDKRNQDILSMVDKQLAEIRGSKAKKNEKDAPKDAKPEAEKPEEKAEEKAAAPKQSDNQRIRKYIDDQKQAKESKLKRRAEVKCVVRAGNPSGNSPKKQWNSISAEQGGDWEVVGSEYPSLN